MEQHEPVVTVLLNGKSLSALVDTGCSQTLVQAKFIPADALIEQDTVTVFCVHGDGSDLPIAEVEIDNQAFLMRVGIAKSLPYPVLLGTDMPILPDLVQESALCGVVTRAKAQQNCQAEHTSQSELHALPFMNVEDIEEESRPTTEERQQNRRSSR